jgi:hypothetical protein
VSEKASDRASGKACDEGLDDLSQMFYQISWTTLPGLRGLACSEFRAAPTVTPDYERGVAIECATGAECEALLVELEMHFGPQRFLNASAAFDGVKDFIAQRMARR